MSEQSDQTMFSGRLILWVTAAAIALSLLIDFQLYKYEYDHHHVSILAFEFAGSFSTFNALLSAVGDSGRPWVDFSLRFDFLFIVVYATALLLLFRALSMKLVRRGARYLKLARLTRLLAYLGPVAGLLDSAENLMLLHSLDLWGRLQPVESGTPGRISDAIDVLLKNAALLAGGKFFIIVSMLCFMGAMYLLLANDRNRNGRTARTT
jgi:hypothetical protein